MCSGKGNPRGKRDSVAADFPRLVCVHVCEELKGVRARVHNGIWEATVAEEESGLTCGTGSRATVSATIEQRSSLVSGRVFTAYRAEDEGRAVANAMIVQHAGQRD